MANLQVTYTFVANTKARSAQVNQNFQDTLTILRAHHHDPNIYTGASPITNSGIAANAQILATQFQYPITLSGLINFASLDNVPVAKGGLGMASVNDYDIPYGLGGSYRRLPKGTASTILGVDPTGTFLQYQAVPDSSVYTGIAGENLVLGDALHITPYYQSDGGILLDTQGVSAFAGTTNQTQSVTVASNSNRALLVGIVSTSAPSAVSYNSVAMTLIDSQVLSAGFTLYAYKLAAPSTGANNILVTATGIYGISWASYYNVSQASLVEASAKSTSASVGGTTTSISGISQCAFIHMFAADVHSGTPSAVVGSASSKYSSGASVNAAVLGNLSGEALATISVSRFNQVFNTSVSASFTGVFGSGSSSNIAVSLAPATTPTVAVVRANASAVTFNEPLIDFVGLASAVAVAGASIAIKFTNVLSGMSGLTVGQKYYLQNSAGAIGTSRGTYGKAVGYAQSTTTFFVLSEKTMGAQISKGAGYTFTAECDGIVSITGTSGGTLSIQADGVTTTITGTGTSGSQISVPVSRGKTYLLTGNGGQGYFTPLT